MPLVLKYINAGDTAVIRVEASESDTIINKKPVSHKRVKIYATFTLRHMTRKSYQKRTFDYYDATKTALYSGGHERTSGTEVLWIRKLLYPEKSGTIEVRDAHSLTGVVGCRDIGSTFLEEDSDMYNRFPEYQKVYEAFDIWRTSFSDKMHFDTFIAGVTGKVQQ